VNKRTAAFAPSDAMETGTWTQLLAREVEAVDASRVNEPAPMLGVVVGTIVGLSGDDVPLVNYPRQADSAGIRCRTIVEIRADHVGRSALLMFEGGDPGRPIIIGCLREPVEQPLQRATVEVEADGRRLTVCANDQIVLRCGKASITLTKAGKVIMQGEYISQRSAGVIRIKGGCVEIN